MKQFLKKLFLFLVIFVVLLITKKAITPYELGNVYYKPKLEYFQHHNKKEAYNTVTFGSSRIYRHINPHVFDSILIKENTKTFNFATVATYNPESYFLYKNYIQELEENTVKYAFLELQALNELSDENSSSTQGTYWNNLEFLNYSVQYIIASNRNDYEKMNLISNYAKSFAYSFLDVKIFKNYLMDTKNTVRRMGVQGFYSLDDDLVETVDNKVLKRRKETFLDDLELLNERRAATIDLSNNYSNLPVNKFHYEFLVSLIEQSEDKGIHLIFILPPRLPEEQYLELIPLANKLSDEHIIQLADPAKYHELYDLENSYDIGHLNANGAKCMTSYLAREFENRLSSISD